MAALGQAKRTLRWLQSRQVVSRVRAYYDQHDDDWHERIMLAHISDHRFVGFTAHWDMYDGDRAAALRLLPLGPRGGMPVPAPGGRVLRASNACPSGELQQRCDEATQMVAEIRAAEGLPDPPVEPRPSADTAAPAGAMVPDGAGGAEAAATSLGPAASAAGALAATCLAPAGAAWHGGASGPLRAAVLAPPAAPSPDATWVAAETRGGPARGAPIPPALLTAKDRPLATLWDRGAIVLGTGASLAVAVAHAPEAEPPALASGSGDLQTCFHGAVAKRSTAVFPDWKIKRFKSAAWLLEKISEPGHTPRRRHSRWRSAQGLTASDDGVDRQLAISDVLTELTTNDQLHAGERVVAEILCRWCQLWKGICASCLREAEVGQGAAPWLDERAIFLGQDRGRGWTLVCPAPESWVAEKLRG
ncbi:unnamed protein product [Prorocentrum cordatum]|uniref:Uncharacterized protein n=1 Tax=Prorocentrum cordatum TaxID=2364126 RepID=A0ABN9XYW0_9DINO|nr:unnamed protein product [Polarella glacialis]